jgi:hypothetical protein
MAGFLFVTLVILGSILFSIAKMVGSNRVSTEKIPVVPGVLISVLFTINLIAFLEVIDSTY